MLSFGAVSASAGANPDLLPLQFKPLSSSSELTIQSPSLSASVADPTSSGSTRPSGTLLQRFDLKAQSWAQEHRTDKTNRIAGDFRDFGNPLVVVKPLAALFIYGELSGNDNAVRTAKLSTESILLGGAATDILKRLIKRPRPNNRNTPDSDLARTSFPSGHTTVAFALATVVASEYGGAIPYLAYGSAALTGWSRINDNVHWTSDVLFGALIGYTAGRIVVRHSGDSGNQPAESRVACPVTLRMSF